MGKFACEYDLRVLRDRSVDAAKRNGESSSARKHSYHGSTRKVNARDRNAAYLHAVDENQGENCNVCELFSLSPRPLAEVTPKPQSRDRPTPHPTPFHITGFSPLARSRHIPLAATGEASPWQ